LRASSLLYGPIVTYPRKKYKSYQFIINNYTDASLHIWKKLE
jgi:hypothetical protein